MTDSSANPNYHLTVLGRRTIFPNDWTLEWPKMGLLFVTIAVLLRFKKLPEPIVVLAAAILGLVIYPLVR